MAKATAKKSITTTQIADDLGIESKTLRVWLRAHDYGVGRGKQYKFTKKQAKAIKVAYESDED